MRMENGWNDNDMDKTKVLRKEPVPLQFYVPQVNHGLAWDRAMALAMRGRNHKQNGSMKFRTNNFFHPIATFQSLVNTILLI